MKAPKPTSESSGELRQRALSGVRWTALSRLLAEGAGFAAVLVTARLLTPAEVGQAALGFIVTAVGGALAQQGFGAPLVRKHEVSIIEIRSAHAVSVPVGIAAGALVFLAAPLASGLGAEVVTVIRWASLAFPIVALGAVPLALLQRELEFKTLARIDASASLIGAVATVGLAAAGAGPVSLIAGPLFVYALTTALAVTKSPNVWGRPSATAARSIVRFGAPVAASGFLYIATRNVTYGILAARLSPASVGYFFRANQLAVEYQSKVSTIMLKMSLPLLSKAADRDQLRAIRVRMTRLHAVALFPFLALLGALAPEAVPLLFGPQWHAAVVPAQILAVGGAAAVINTGTNSVLVAAGHPKAMLAYHIFEFVTLASVTAAFVGDGLVAVCIAVVACQLALTVVLQRAVVQPIVGIPASETLGSDLIAPVTACIPLFAVAFAAERAASAELMPGPLACLLGSLTGLAVYAGTLRMSFPDVWKDTTAVFSRSRS